MEEWRIWLQANVTARANTKHFRGRARTEEEHDDAEGDRHSWKGNCGVLERGVLKHIELSNHVFEIVQVKNVSDDRVNDRGA